MGHCQISNTSAIGPVLQGASVGPGVVLPPTVVLLSRCDWEGRGGVEVQGWEAPEGQHHFPTTSRSVFLASLAS